MIAFGNTPSVGCSRPSTMRTPALNYCTSHQSSVVLSPSFFPVMSPFHRSPIKLNFYYYRFRPKYKIDLNLKEENEGYHTLATSAGPIGRKNLLQQEKQLINSSPVGAAAAGGSSSSGTVAPPVDATAMAASAQQQKNLQAKLQSKAMALATKPGQQIMMNAFMMWMSGKNLNIFSITTTAGAIMNPLQGILSVGKTFGPMEEQNANVQVPKLIFIVLNLVWLGVGLYKMSSMRLLPTTSADWTGSIVWKDMMETTSIPPL